MSDPKRVSGKGEVKVGDEFGWTSIIGTPHYGGVTALDSNVVYIRCWRCGKECCTELGDEWLSEGG